MGILLDNGKYQVLENLFSESGYTASVCIDIEAKSNYKPLVFNIYSDPSYISAYLPLYYRLISGGCSYFKRIISGDGCIMAVFSYHKGIPLTDYLKSLPRDDFEARARAAGLFLDAALELDMLPPALAVSALSPPNTVYDIRENVVYFNFLVKPFTSSDEKDILTLLSDYLENAFVKNRYLPELASDFPARLKDGRISGLVAVCSEWRRISAGALEEYNRYKEESFLGYVKRKSKSRLKTRLKLKEND